MAPALAVALLAGAACGTAAPDLILHGGAVLRGDGALAGEAVAITAGRIAAVGSDGEVLALLGGDTRVVDLGGRVAMPSLKDHHVHMQDLGLSLLNERRGEALFLDLAGARSVAEVAARVAERAARLPGGSWIAGKGWSQAAWGEGAELPGHTPLTAAAPRHPVFLARTDGHAGWVNAEALRRAGIDAASPDPEGGQILRLQDGSPAGILLERANEAVLEQLAPPSAGELAEAFSLAAADLASRGVTDVFDAGGLGFPGVVSLEADFAAGLAALRTADRRAALPVRVRVMVPAPSALAEAVLAEPARFRDSERVVVTHLKLFADGALGSRGAALAAPYADAATTRGVPRMTAHEIEALAARALAAGLDVATHAIGDAAIAAALDAYQALIARRGGLAPGRLRIEHFSAPAAGDLARAARLGVVLVVQPGFVYPDDAGRAMEDARLGAARGGRAYALGTLLRGGARLAGSSDDFATPLPAFWPVYAAATRRNPGGHPEDGWHPAERLARNEALSLFTRLHPPGGGEPRGGLAPGEPADLVIVPSSPASASDRELLELRVSATLRAGGAVYDDGSLGAGLPR